MSSPQKGRVTHRSQTNPPLTLTGAAAVYLVSIGHSPTHKTNHKHTRAQTTDSQTKSVTQKSESQSLHLKVWTQSQHHIVFHATARSQAPSTPSEEPLSTRHRNPAGVKALIINILSLTQHRFLVQSESFPTDSQGVIRHVYSAFPVTEEKGGKFETIYLVRIEMSIPGLDGLRWP